jgi:hypothetical protein
VDYVVAQEPVIKKNSKLQLDSREGSRSCKNKIDADGNRCRR